MIGRVIFNALIIAVSEPHLSGDCRPLLGMGQTREFISGANTLKLLQVKEPHTDLLGKPSLALEIPRT